ncbi:MAG: hypothetical protein ABI361_08025 [Nitrososphaera sp.]
MQKKSALINRHGANPQVGPLDTQIGTSILQSGWQPHTTLKANLQSDYLSDSAYNSYGIHLMVFPLTS